MTAGDAFEYERGKATAAPGSAYVDGCACRAVLIDYVRRTVGHPYFACPFYGTTTLLDDAPS